MTHLEENITPPLATIAKDGTRVSIKSFAIRRRLRDLIPEDEYKTTLIVLEKRRETRNIYPEVYPQADNGELHDWVMCGDDKYGRVMYCLKTKEFRHLTMGEFYENSTVD